MDVMSFRVARQTDRQTDGSVSYKTFDFQEEGAGGWCDLDPRARRLGISELAVKHYWWQ